MEKKRIKKVRLRLASAIFCNAVPGGVGARGAVSELLSTRGFGAPISVGPIKQGIENKIASKNAESHDHRDGHVLFLRRRRTSIPPTKSCLIAD
jgi:hypothetical protein